jgi:hypothetical protein
MEIDQILKQATAYKKSDGTTFALDFLIKSYNEILTDDLPKYLDKINTYFSKDINNLQVKQFISELINSNKIEKYSGLLSNYYWILKDYESYKLTIMKQISEVNPNNPWQYCNELKNLQISLCNYYNVKGLDNEEHAIEYLYNLISSLFFDVAGELMMYDYNFTGYHSHLRFGRELKFYYPDRLIPLSESVEKWFVKDSDKGNICLKTMKCTMPTNQVIKLIKESIFSNFPKQVGFNIDILDKNYNDTSTFALSFFNKTEYNDILSLTDKIKNWRIQIADKAVSNATEETNNILKKLYQKE